MVTVYFAMLRTVGRPHPLRVRTTQVMTSGRVIQGRFDITSSYGAEAAICWSGVDATGGEGARRRGALRAAGAARRRRDGRGPPRVRYAAGGRGRAQGAAAQRRARHLSLQARVP